ncbi:hypothetical protein HDA44_003236 [Kribbella solani]|uniref:Uncharacterized protein n=1 Tax=Kribbella solani TaxID=236067 RepID=A0A841DSN5_9ACTN|nr:hypothetical protein [Kribbella solani]
MRGVVASPIRSSPRAGRMWFLRTRREVSREVGDLVLSVTISSNSSSQRSRRWLTLCIAVSSPDFLVLARSWSFWRSLRSAADFGVAERGYVSDVPVVVAEVGLGEVFDRLALGVGFDDASGDASPGSDRQWRSGHVRPPTGVVVGSSTPAARLFRDVGKNEKRCDVTHSHDRAKVGGLSQLAVDARWWLSLRPRSGKEERKGDVADMKKPRAPWWPGLLCAARDSNPEPAEFHLRLTIACR